MQAIRHHGLSVPDSLSTDVDALQISCSRLRAYIEVIRIEI